MILRRFTEHVKQQNWFAVGLDLIVVVVGIYIGLQADAWMSGQRDREIEQEYLLRLLDDMEFSAEAQGAAIATFDDSIDAMDYLAVKIRDGEWQNADPERVRVAIDALGWVVRPVTKMTTVRELQSTGNILLIQDIEIRDAIGQLESSYANAEFGSSQNLGVISQSMPEVMAWSFLAPIETDSPYRSEPENLNSLYIIEPDFERIVSHPQAANIISWISGWSKFHGTLLVLHHEDIVAFRELLRERIPTHSNSSAP